MTGPPSTSASSNVHEIGTYERVITRESKNLSWNATACSSCSRVHADTALTINLSSTSSDRNTTPTNFTLVLLDRLVGTDHVRVEFFTIGRDVSRHEAVVESVLESTVGMH